MLFCKISIAVILLYQLFISKGSSLNEEFDFNDNVNSIKNIKQEINNKLVSAYIDFADVLSEHEVKINKTIDQKLDNIMNKLNELGNEMVLLGNDIKILNSTITTNCCKQNVSSTINCNPNR